MPDMDRAGVRPPFRGSETASGSPVARGPHVPKLALGIAAGVDRAPFYACPGACGESHWHCARGNQTPKIGKAPPPCPKTLFALSVLCLFGLPLVNERSCAPPADHFAGALRQPRGRRTLIHPLPQGPGPAEHCKTFRKMAPAPLRTKEVVNERKATRALREELRAGGMPRGGLGLLPTATRDGSQNGTALPQRRRTHNKNTLNAARFPNAISASSTTSARAWPAVLPARPSVPPATRDHPVGSIGKADRPHAARGLGRRDSTKGRAKLRSASGYRRNAVSSRATKGGCPPGGTVPAPAA